MLDGRLLSDGNSRASRHDEDQLRTDHVKCKAKGSRQNDLTLPDDRSSGQTISGVHAHAESWWTVDFGTRLAESTYEMHAAPKFEKSREIVEMGLEGSAMSMRRDDSPVDTREEQVNQSPESLAHTFDDELMTITYDDGLELVEHAPLSQSQYHIRNPVQDETLSDKDWLRQSRLRDKQELLPALRLRNLETRTRAYESRRELGELRLEAHRADQEHMRLVREDFIRERKNLVENYRTEDSIYEDEVKLKASFERLQAARDRYGPLEETYNALEALLDRQEHEVTKLEQQIAKYSVPGQDQDDLDALSSTSEDSDLEDSQHIEDLYPSYNQYMISLGYANMLQEDLAELVFEQNRLLEQQDIRRRLGRDLLPDDQDILADFPAQEARIQHELSHINADVQRLRVQCIQEGLLDDRVVDSDLRSSGVLLEEARDESIESANYTLQTSSTQSEYDRFPSLLEKPYNSPDLETSRNLITDFKSGDTGNRIECWLLHKLRCSCSEVELLARFSTSTFHEFEGVGPELIKNSQIWQEEVLEFWFFDSTNRPPTAYEIKPTAMISPAEMTVKADATANTNTVILQPQSTVQSETLGSNARPTLRSEVFTSRSPQPADIPLPVSPLPVSPQPSTIPLPPSPPFELTPESSALPRASPIPPSVISTSPSTSNPPSPISTTPSPVSTLPSGLQSPLPFPPINSYFSSSLISKDMNIVSEEINKGNDDQDQTQLSDLDTSQGTDRVDSSDTCTGLTRQADTCADPDADVYRVELVIHSVALDNNKKNENERRLDFGLLLQIRREYPFPVA